jgi:hypothetical protein
MGPRATRSKPVADRRSTSARGGWAAASQSLSTTRCRAGCQGVVGGRWVWPWIRVRAPGRPAARRWRRGRPHRHRARPTACVLRSRCADAARLGAALCQGLGQEVLLAIACAARLHAKALVVHIVQAQRVAMAEQQALALPDQHGGVMQAGDAAGVPGKAGADEKVAVAVHERTAHVRCGWRLGAGHRPGLQNCRGSSSASSPTQTSNRSPRMNRASAGVVCR